jgi:hypothetical protein
LAPGHRLVFFVRLGVVVLDRLVFFNELKLFFDQFLDLAFQLFDFGFDLLHCSLLSGYELLFLCFGRVDEFFLFSLELLFQVFNLLLSFRDLGLDLLLS